MSFARPRLAGLILLLSLIGAVSFVWHLPAARLQPHLPLPQALTSDLTRGPWHEGETLLRWQKQPAGRLQWQLHPAVLLLGRVDTTLHWQRSDSSLKGTLTVPLFDPALHFKDTEGVLNLATLRTLMPPVLAQLQPGGRITLDTLQGALTPTSPRPQLHRLEGSMSWLNGRLMGFSLDLPLQIRWHTRSNEETNIIIGTLSGQNERGQLTGELRILPDQTVHYQLQFFSDQSPVPDWVKLVMQRQSENHWSVQGKLSP